MLKKQTLILLFFGIYFGAVCGSAISFYFDGRNGYGLSLGKLIVTHKIKIPFLAFFDRNRKIGLILDLEANTVLEVDQGAVEKAYKLFLTSNDINEIQKINGKKYQQSSVPYSVLAEVADFQEKFGAAKYDDLKAGLDNLLKRVKVMYDAVNGPMHGFFNGKGSFDYHFGSPNNIYRSLTGLDFLVKETQGNLKSLLGNIKIDIKDLFSSTNGLEVLLKFISQISLKVDISEKLGKVISNEAELNTAVGNMIGDSPPDSVNFLLSIFVKIMDSNSQSNINKLQSVISNLIKFKKINPSEIDTLEQILLKIIENQEKEFHNKNSLTNFINYIMGIIKETRNIYKIKSCENEKKNSKEFDSDESNEESDEKENSNKSKENKKSSKEDKSGSKEDKNGSKEDKNRSKEEKNGSKENK